MQKVVFNANYLAYIDDATDTWMRTALGEFETTGFDFMVKKITIEWQSAARFGEQLELDVEVRRWGTSSFDVGVTGRWGALGARGHPGLREHGPGARDPPSGAGRGPDGAGRAAARVTSSGPPSVLLPPRQSGRGARAAEQGARDGTVPRADRRGRGLRRVARPGQPRLPRPDGAHHDDVRSAGPPVRLLHLRDALLRQRGDRRARGRPGGAPASAGAARRARTDARPPTGRSWGPGPDERTGEALPSAGHRSGRRRHGPRPRAAVRIVDDGTPPPDDPGISTRIGITRAADLPWRWFVAGDPNISR